MASLDTISGKAGLVRAFTMASIKGIDEALKNPEAAVDAMIKYRPEIANQRAVQLAQFKGLTPLQQQLLGYGPDHASFWGIKQGWIDDEIPLRAELKERGLLDRDVPFLR